MYKKSIRVLIVLGLFLGCLGIGIKGEEVTKKLEILYFYNNPCASCEVENEFYEMFNTQVGYIKDQVNYELKLYNIFSIEGRKFFEQVCESYNIKEELRQEPLMIIGEEYLIGDDQIQRQLRDTFTQQSKKLPESKIELGEINSKKDNNNIAEENNLKVDPKESHLIYFYTTACEDCNKTKKFLNELDKTYEIKKEDEIILSEVVVESKNIAELENTDLINTYFQQYQVDQNRQQVPIIFYEEGYLSGYESIEKELSDTIESGKALKFTYPMKQETISELGISELPQIFVTGLINGFNPCSISMLLLLLSLMSVGSDMLKLGFAYIGGKVLTYLALGTVCYSLLAGLDSIVFQSVQGITNIIIVIIMLLLAGTNLLDYLAAKEQKYHKIRLQLPVKLRQFNHRMIEKFIKQTHSKYAVVGVFVLGIVISAGEFLCTGQIYLATIIYLLKRTAGYSGITLIALLLYVGAMVLPLCLLIILAYKGHRILVLSEFVRKHMTKIKMINAILFIVFAIIILYL